MFMIANYKNKFPTPRKTKNLEKLFSYVQYKIESETTGRKKIGRNVFNRNS